MAVPHPRRRQRPEAIRNGSDSKQFVISAFILFHLVAISVWCLPFPPPLINGVRDTLQPYMWWSGLFQNWDMFAPQPMSLNSYVEAEIVFSDGRTKTWAFPRMEKLSLVDRCFRERYRKYVNDCLRSDDNAVLWPDAARYVARANNQASNPPIAVMLYRYWSEIRPPLPDGSPSAGPWMRSRFYLYAVKPGDLQ